MAERTVSQLRIILDELALKGGTINMEEVKLLYGKPVRDEWMRVCINHWARWSDVKYKKLYGKDVWVRVSTSLTELIAEANETFKASARYPYVIVYDPETGAFLPEEQKDTRRVVHPKNMYLTCLDAANYAIAKGRDLFLNYYGVN